MSRRLSGFKPTGYLHLGNYLGAIRPMVRAQDSPDSHRDLLSDADIPGTDIFAASGTNTPDTAAPNAAPNTDIPGADITPQDPVTSQGQDHLFPARHRSEINNIVMVADLHALTVTHDPATIQTFTRHVATALLAAGVDPDRSLFFVQSHVPEHTELHYLLEATTGYGEAHRMIQFKERSAREGKENIRLALLTYPVLMASDILLYDVDEVPVGEDQRQHVELTRTVARRFNQRYGPTFVVPRVTYPVHAARVKNLSDPRIKMEKSRPPHTGVIFLLDPPDVLRHKIMRAVTDQEAQIRYDPQAQPGIANLLEILGACLDLPPATLAHQYGGQGYRRLKETVADVVIETLRPIQRRYAELEQDPAYLSDVLKVCAGRAREYAAQTVDRARRAMGLLP